MTAIGQPTAGRLMRVAATTTVTRVQSRRFSSTSLHATATGSCGGKRSPQGCSGVVTAVARQRESGRVLHYRHTSSGLWGRRQLERRWKWKCCRREKGFCRLLMAILIATATTTASSSRWRGWWRPGWHVVCISRFVHCYRRCLVCITS